MDTGNALLRVHADLYGGLPEGVVIELWPNGTGSTTMVGGDVPAVALALGLNEDTDSWTVDQELEKRAQALWSEIEDQIEED
jgi:hypothetical protein